MGESPAGAEERRDVPAHRRAMMVRCFCLAAAVCLLLAGCRGNGATGDTTTGPRAGPSLDRLVGKVRDSPLTPAEKRAYWQGAAGRVISGTGTVVRVFPDHLLLDCPVESRAV